MAKAPKTTAKVETYEIDILQMEIDQKLPHWLDPRERYPEKFAANRAKHRARWLAEQEQKKREKRWQTVKAAAETALARPLPGGQDGLYGKDVQKDVDYIQDPETGRFGGSRPGGGAGGGGTGGRSGAGSPSEAQSRATTAAAGHASLAGLPAKPIKVGEHFYSPGPLGKAQTAAAAYMKKAGLPYNPPKTYQKVDPARATRVASEYDKMKHDPDNPAVKASYDALAKETIAQWHTIRATGLKIEWIKPGQADPYAKSPRLAAMDVIDNNHLWVFPTDLGYGGGDDPKHNNNPMLQKTDEAAGGRAMLVNDVFRIVHDYFGHFKEGVGFRADGEENAWRSHSAMYSPLARGAMTAETRGQNSWVNYGPHGEANRTASSADTHYAPQKIGLMPEWTHTEGSGDPGGDGGEGDEAAATTGWPANAIDKNASVEEKVRQLNALTKVNHPAVKNFASRVGALAPQGSPDEVRDFILNTPGSVSEVSVKKPETIASKATRPEVLRAKPWFGVEHIRDSLRFRTSVDSFKDVKAIVDEIEASGLFNIVKYDYKKLTEPKAFGWRILPIDMTMKNGQIVEYYILPKELREVADEGHEIFDKWRDTDRQNLSVRQKAERDRDTAYTTKLYADAWKRYFERTGETEEDLRAAVMRR